MKINKTQYDIIAKGLILKTRPSGVEFYHFTDEILADKELYNYLLEMVDIRDLDYQILNDALDVLLQYEYEHAVESSNDVIENNTEHASVYNDERLAYINNWNEHEIMDIVKSYNTDSINLACAIWYDEQVNNILSTIINDIK